jgi:hypothetical protein
MQKEGGWVMKKRYLLLLTVLATVLLVALPGTAIASGAFSGPLQITQAHLLTASPGESWEVDASVVGSNYFAGFPPRAREPVHGLISVNYSGWSFKLRPKYHIAIDHFSGMPDAGAVAGMAGYVVESAGEGAPAVGDFYAFYFFDGAQGLTQPAGTIRYYQDRWIFHQATDTPLWLRTFPRNVLHFFDSQGIYGLWLSEGDISIRNGLILE